MAVQGLTITLTTTPTATLVAGDGIHGVLRVTVRNSGNAGTVYLGGASVTTAGYRLTSADTPLSVQLFTGESLYCLSSGGAAVLDVLRHNDTT